MRRTALLLATAVLLSFPAAALAGDGTRPARIATRIKVPPRTIPRAAGVRGAMQRLFGAWRETHATSGVGYDFVTTTQRDRYRWDRGARALTLRTSKVWSVGTRSHDPFLGGPQAQDFWWARSKTVYRDGGSRQRTTGSYRERGFLGLGRLFPQRYRLGEPQ